MMFLSKITLKLISLYALLNLIEHLDFLRVPDYLAAIIESQVRIDFVFTSQVTIRQIDETANFCK